MSTDHEDSVRVKIGKIETSLANFIAEYRRDELAKKEFRKEFPLPCTLHAEKITSLEKTRTWGKGWIAALTSAGAFAAWAYDLWPKGGVKHP